ncbi:MAG: transporter [Candidatus Riflebacteria bacterium]|nr:transporter [Candidatus Riflebacteria bacterium]
MIVAACRVLTPLLCFVCLGWAASPAHQDLPSDVTKLTLEELMTLRVDLFSTGVMGTHTHHKGEWMVANQFTSMNLKGNRRGSQQVDVEDVLGRYPMAETGMFMSMTSVEVMHAPSDELSFTLMIPFIRKEMDQIQSGAMGGMGVSDPPVLFRTRSEGIGDVHLGSTMQVYKKGGVRLLANASLSLPTGSIDRWDQTPTGSRRLPYSMQLGSGTFDLLPGLICLHERRDGVVGVSVGATTRLGENSNGYRLGDELHWAAWVARKITGWFSVHLRLDGQSVGRLGGRDALLDTANTPAEDPDQQGGDRTDALCGLDFYVPKGRFQKLRFTIEAGVPVYQRLNGTQLETDFTLGLRLQYVW